MPRLRLVFLFATTLTLAACAPDTTDDEAVDEDESAQTQNAALEAGSTLTTTVNLRLRKTPEKAADNIIRVMRRGSKVIVLEAEVKDGFAHVKFHDDKENVDHEGWAWRAYLRGAKSATPTAPAPTAPTTSGSTSGAAKNGCKAGVIGDEFEGRTTDNNETFTQSSMTATRQAGAFDSVFPYSPAGKNTVRITNTATKKSVDVRINDKGELNGRCLDLSKAAFEAIGADPSSNTTIDVTYQKI